MRAGAAPCSARARLVRTNIRSSMKITFEVSDPYLQGSLFVSKKAFIKFMQTVDEKTNFAKKGRAAINPAFSRLNCPSLT